MTRRWRRLDVLREAVRNTVAWSARPSSMLITAGVVGILVVAHASSEHRSLQRLLAVHTAAGAGTVIVSSIDPTTPAAISASSCAAVAGLAGVRRAGPVDFVGQDSVVQLGPKLPVVATTPALVPELADAPVVVGPALPLTGPRVVRSTWFGSVVAVRAPDVPAGVPSEYGISIHLDPARRIVPLCVAVVEPGVDASRLLGALAATLEVSRGEVLARVHLMGRSNPLEDHAVRQGRWVPAVAGAAVGVLGGLMLRFRGSELAIYRLSGSRRRDVLAIVLVEQIVTIGCFLTVAGVGLLAGATPQWDVGPTVLRLFAAAAAWLVVVMPFAARAACRNPFEQARDR